jgi:hypothetical protein
VKNSGEMNMTRETFGRLIFQEATFHDIPVPDQRWAERCIKNNCGLVYFERSLDEMDVSFYGYVLNKFKILKHYVQALREFVRSMHFGNKVIFV